MTENTKVGRELYYLIEDIIKDSLCRLHESYCTWRNEYPDLGREEFEERFTDHYSELSEELFFKIVEDDKLTEIENFSPKSYDLMEESFQPELEGVTVIQMDKKKPRESVKKLHETFKNIFGE